jgi:hypothetical protein
MLFPSLTARDLEGRTIEIPAGLSLGVNLVVLAFQRDHQQPLETWLPHFTRLEGEFRGLEVWRVAALPRGYRLWRGAIDSGMRAGISDPGLRRHTLTVYLDLSRLQRALDLPDLGDVHLLLVDASGTIRWRGRGGYNEATLVSLRKVLGEVSIPS